MKTINDGKVITIKTKLLSPLGAQVRCMIYIKDELAAYNFSSADLAHTLFLADKKAGEDVEEIVGLNSYRCHIKGKTKEEIAKDIIKEIKEIEKRNKNGKKF
jgi:SRSO17 transposase